MSYSHLNTSSLNDWLEANEQLSLVDIRDPMSYSSGHISGSIRLDNLTLPTFLEQADKQKPLVVVCYHGNSSQGAAQWLSDQGFEQVFSLDGGFTEWHSRFPDQVES